MRANGQIFLYGCVLLIVTFLDIHEVSAQLPQKSHLSAWFSADSVTFSTSSFINKIKDISGKGNDAVQNNVSQQPKQNKVIKLNNHNVITFDGINDFMNFGAPFNNFFTLFFISKKNGGGGYQHTVEPTSGANAQIAYIDGDKFTWQGSFTSSIFSTQSYNALCVAKKSDSIFFYINNSLNTKSSVVPNLSGSGWVIGTYNGSPVEFFNGDIAEVILYDTLISRAEIDSVNKYLMDKYSPHVNLGYDQLQNFCFKELDAGSRFNSFQWSTSDTTQTITPSQPGKYWVRVKGVFGFTSSDTVTIQLVKPNLLKDSVNCNGSPIVWDLGLSKTYYNFLWSNLSLDSQITVNQPGKYYAIVTDSSGCVFKTDTLLIAPDNFPVIATLGNDTSFCSGNTIALKNGSSKAKTYLWSDNSTVDFLTITNAGVYSVIIADSLGCIAYDTINVAISGIAPKANFAYSSLSCSGDSIVFNDLSIPPSGNSVADYLWNFGDSKSSTLDNPKHKYLSPDTGKFNVKLTVTTDAGCSKDTTIQLRIYPKPVVDFSVGLVCSEKTAKFTNLSDFKGYPVLTTTWGFADLGSGANNSSTLLNPSHIFTTVGNFAVKLITVNNKGCADSITKTIDVQPSPDALFTSSLACEKQKVYFTDNSTIASPWVIQSFTTNFGDASVSTTTKNPSHTYIIIGSYNVKYIVSANNGCSDTSISTVNVNSKPLAKFGLVEPLCINNVLAFKDSSIVNGSSINSWAWTFDNSQSSILKDPFVPFSVSGVHSAKLLVNSVIGCKDSTTKSFTINPLPKADFSFTPLYGDPPLAVDFTNLSSLGVVSSDWNFGDDSLSTLVAPSHVYQDSGTYQIQLNVTDNNGCVNSVTKSYLIQYAQYDIALLKVIAFVDADNFLNVTLHFGNGSTRPLTSAEFIVDIEGESGFKELWTGNLDIGGITSYTLKTSPRLSSTSAHNYICVMVKKPNMFADIQPSNNQICVGLKTNEFILPEPNPNPVSDNLRIPFIMPFDEEVEVSVFNKLGQKLNDSFNYFATKGYNEITFNTNSLAEGVYTYSITYKGISGTKKFVKRAN